MCINPLYTPTEASHYALTTACHPFGKNFTLWEQPNFILWRCVFKMGALVLILFFFFSVCIEQKEIQIPKGKEFNEDKFYILIRVIFLKCNTQSTLICNYFIAKRCEILNLSWNILCYGPGNKFPPWEWLWISMAFCAILSFKSSITIACSS